MYDRVRANVWKSWALIIGFVLFVMLVGLAFGYAMDFGVWGLVVGFGIAAFLAFTSYFSSDSIALSMSRAQPADIDAHRQLHLVVEALAIGSGLPKPRVFVINDRAPNAFATGRDPKHAAVAVTTGLLEKMNRDELEGVIAHELAHIKNRDILVMTLSVTLVGSVVLLADFLLRAMWWGGVSVGRGRRGDGGGAGAIIAVLGIVLLFVSPLIARVLHFAISRRREFLADADAVLLTRHPAGLIGALEKLRDDRTVVRTASRATAHLWIEAPIEQERRPGQRRSAAGAARLNRLFNTHPPLTDRIAALRRGSLSP